MTRIRYFVLAFLLVSAIAAPASAFSLFSKKPAAPVGQYYIHDDASFQANVRPFHRKPFNDSNYEFDIMIPRDWTAEEITTDLSKAPSQDIPIELYRFKSPMLGTQQATAHVQYLHIPFEVTIENWLHSYALSNGFSLQQQVTLSNDRKKASISFVSTAELKNTFTYLSARLNGNVVMIARFDIPLALRPALGFVQKKTVDSFRLIVPTDKPVEEKRVFTLGDGLKVTYPASWRVRYPDIQDPTNMAVQLHNELPKRPSYFMKETALIAGMIRATAVRRDPNTSLEEQMKLLKKYFNETAGMDIEKLLSSTKADVYGRFLFSRYETYQVRPNKIMAAWANELHLVVLGDKEWYVVVFLLTPTASNNFSTWARNTRTFDLIVKNLK